MSPLNLSRLVRRNPDRLNLKERAAALRAAAVRAMGRPRPEPPLLAQEPETTSTYSLFASQAGRDLSREAFDYARGLSLSDVPFENLWRLYEVFSAANELLGSVELEEMFDDGTRRPCRELTAGGKILDAEVNRLGCLRDACVIELRKRNPRDVAERDARLRILVTHEVCCADRICSKPLLAEIVQAWGA